MRTRKNNTPTKLVSLLLALILLLTACGDDSDKSSDNQMDSKSSLVEEMNSNAEAGETDYPDYTDAFDRATELYEMPDDECMEKDAYKYMGLTREDPEVMPDGSRFYFDCVRNTWGWGFYGNPDDVWEPLLIPAELITAPSNSGPGPWAQLPLEYSGAPMDHQHPAYPDALSASELEFGMMVCVNDGVDNGATRTVIEAFSLVFLDESGDPTRSLPVWSTRQDGINEDRNGARSLILDGLIPNNFGVWDTTYTTAGPCT